MDPVPASKWKKLPADIRERSLKGCDGVSGMVPVNDVFLPAWNVDSEIVLLYGSYGSGKSVFVADKWIDKALTQKYFRGYFGRKVFDTVRGTVFQTFVDRIRELHKEHLFSFSDKPNGSMIITCRENGNQMIPFGANDSASLKSIKDPTDFFCEEFDQFTFTDFGFIFSRLRTEKAKTQFWASFNTERVYKSHFIRVVFFDGEYKSQAFRLLANYTDNYFVDREKYDQKLRLIANNNAAVYNAIARGEWGMVRTGNEFWKGFSESKHVRALERLQSTIHVSLDENVNPYVTVSCWQIDTAAKQVRQIHELPCTSPDNNAPKAAKKTVEWLRQIGYQDTVYIYGDPSAGKRSTVDPNNRSFFDKFIEVLRSEGFTVVSRVQRSAPEVALSAAFINEIYESNLNGWSILIHERCFTSIEDYLLTKEDADGKMLKKRITDKETKISYEPEGHFSDAKRYFITTVLAAEFERYKSRGRKRGAMDVKE